MSEKILVPVLGESITEATVSKWLKKKGDKVVVDEAVVELETDKVNLEVPAPLSGIISEINSKDGDTVEVGTVLGMISEGSALKGEKEAEPIKEKVEKNNVINLEIEKKKEACKLLITKKNIDEIFIWIVFGIIFGARLGYVIFYNFDFYINNPLLILSLWEGGMSFHGGAIGVIVAIIYYSKYYRIPILETGDVICAVVPIGLFFGRIANFINGELWGKETNFSWGVIFPNAGINPRHPSQLYEAGLEGLILFIILLVMVFNNGLKKKGLISGTFLFFYSFSRIIIENFREPDSHIGYIIPNITMGMILSLPFLVAGFILIFRSIKNEYS